MRTFKLRKTELGGPVPQETHPASSWFLLRFPREKPLRATVAFSSSMCEVRHNPRDVLDITSSYFYIAGSPKRSSYVAERTRKRQNRFTNSFYQFNFNLFVLGAGRRFTQRN